MQNAVIDLINQMFIIAGHNVTYDEIKDRKDEWYLDWTMTEEEYCEWKKFGTKYLMKSLNMNKGLAQNEMNWFGLMYGLKFENPQFKLHC